MCTLQVYDIRKEVIFLLLRDDLFFVSISFFAHLTLQFTSSGAYACKGISWLWEHNEA